MPGAGDCRRQDGRLPVLLVLALLILAADCLPWSAWRPPRPAMHWLELPGNGYLCCGFSALDHLDRLPAGRSLIDQFNRESGRKIFPAGDREVPAAAMLEGKDGAWRSADVSPRLAFLTGRPLPLNRAGGGELTLVPGIGPYLAANILSYRSRHGSIDSERELTAVTGIGRVRAARLSPYLSFE